MTIERLMALLEDWSLWMKHDSHRLGYPSKSLGISGGHDSSHDAFEFMVDESDKKILLLSMLLSITYQKSKERLSMLDG